MPHECNVVLARRNQSPCVIAPSSDAVAMRSVARTLRSRAVLADTKESTYAHNLIISFSDRPRSSTGTWQTQIALREAPLQSRRESADQKLYFFQRFSIA